MRTYFLCWSVLCGLSVSATAQSLRQDQDTLVQQLEAQYRQDSLRAAAIAREQGFPLYYTTGDGTIIGFAGFSETGMMLFNTTCNRGAGQTVGTNRVWPGGTEGTSLTGALSGNRLGIWDGGGVRMSHQEFSGRVVQVDNAGTDMHPTHVAGTMIAAGVDAGAKGMAYEATLRAYDWNNDDGEMTAAARAGMLISNHSYGQVAGWNRSSGNMRWYGDVSISAVEDYNYGFYSRRAETWDRIAANNPGYLICKAAGNDRGNSHSGTHQVLTNSGWQTSTAQRDTVGPYDCIATYAIAKNILTVGAVRKITGGWTKPSDVVMTDFSGWGPADDGRIKPDVVAPGQGLRSANNDGDDEYESASGTSMAAPVVSGSLLLLQEQYHDLHNDSFMLAATLKGLTIHTTDEAGTTPGPDYQHGWGLINIPRAVALINSGLPYSIQQRTLGNKETFSQSYETDGSEPLKLTICWTDPPGKPVAPALDPPDLMLVNDLDIRLIRKSDSAVFYPYILNPATPSAAATTGDNFRDNVEQIFIAAPQAGAYRLVVSHKNKLHEEKPQAYSLIVSGFEPIAPVADFTVQKLTVCTDEPIRFADASENDPHSWDWLFSEVSGTFTDTASQAEISYSTPGVYTIEVTLKVSNYGGADSVKRTITVDVLERPADIQVNGNTHSMAHREESYSVANTPGSAYAWSIDNGTIQSGNGTNEVVVKWGNYLSGRVAVQETNSVSCTGDTAFMDIELEWATRVNDEGMQPVMIYPNPASKHLSVAFHAPADQRIKASITNLVGQTVFTTAWDVVPGSVVKDLYIGAIPPGVYLFRLEGDFPPQVQKIVIR